jgi:biopolymer transport protein ExbB
MNMKSKSITSFFALACIFWMMAGAAPAAAQEVGLPAFELDEKPEPIREEMSIQDIIKSGGIPMYVLGGMSVIGLALVIYYFAVLREGQVMPRKFILELQELLKAERRDDARMACARNGSPIAEIALAAIEHSRTTEETSPELLKEIIEGEGGRQARVIQNQIQYLQDIAAIAPMIGLLGTVIGMLKAFNVVALDVAKAKPMLLAGGVSQALITTAAGLMVGIPAMVFYAYFRGRAAKLVSGLETNSARLLSLLIKKRSS